MILRDQETLNLLQLQLHEMIDHALKIQSLKVMKAYQHQLETHIEKLNQLIRSSEMSSDVMKRNHEKYARQAKEQESNPQQDDKQSTNNMVWIRSGMPMRSLQERARDSRLQWQDEVNRHNALVVVRDNLQQRLEITQALYTTLKFNDFPTITDSVLQAVYDYADIETERTVQALFDMAQRTRIDYDGYVQQMIHLTRRFGDNSGFAI